RRRRPTPDPPPATPIARLVYRLADPRTAHPRRHHRLLVARDQRVRADRDHQRRHRGLQPAGQTGQARRVRIPQPRNPGPPDTIPLHPQTAGRSPDFMLIARSKSKSRNTGPQVIETRPMPKLVSANDHVVDQSGPTYSAESALA